MIRSLGLFVALSMSAAPALAQLPVTAGFVDSTSRPIRVYYNTEENAPLAALALSVAETAWQTQVDGMGFPAPYTVDDDLNPVEGVRIYLQESDTYAGYSMPVAGIDSTPETDCACVLYVADSYPEWYYETLVSHEFNHAVAESIDCVESPFAYEQTTMAVIQLSGIDDPMFSAMLADFQQEPFRAIYYTDFYRPIYNHFGASLFSLFLEHHYGNADGKLLGRMWQAIAQEGVVDFSTGWPESDVPNEPDLLDGIELILNEEGVTLEDAFVEFATQRYFVGSFGDSAHIPGADGWSGAEPKMDARYFMDELPVDNLEPVNPPEELGVSYVAFDLIGMPADQVLRLRFAGTAGVTWNVRALSIGAGPARELPMTLDEGNTGSLMVDGLKGGERVVLVVTNLGDGEYDSDDPSRRASTFVYSASLLDCPAVNISRAKPFTIEQGAETKVTLSGSGFASAQGIDIQVSGNGVTVVNTVRRSSSALDVTFDVASGAKEGRRDLSVSLECGATATAPKLLEVEGAGGCSSSDVLTSGAWLALLCLLRRPRKSAK